MSLSSIFESLLSRQPVTDWEGAAKEISTFIFDADYRDMTASELESIISKHTTRATKKAAEKAAREQGYGSYKIKSAS